MLLQSEKWNVHIFEGNFCAIDLWKNISRSRSRSRYLFHSHIRKIIFCVAEEEKTNIFHYHLVNKSLLLLLSYWKVLCFRDLCKMFTILLKGNFVLVEIIGSDFLFSFDCQTMSSPKEMNVQMNELTAIGEKFRANFQFKLFSMVKRRRFLSLKNLCAKMIYTQMEQNVPTFHCIESLHLSTESLFSYDFEISFFNSKSVSFQPFHS